MNGYFKPLRRKIGVLTLMVACTLATVFLRDARPRHRGRQLVFRTSQARHVVTSDENGITWWREWSSVKSKTIDWIKFGEVDDATWDPLYGFRPSIPYTDVSWKQQMKDCDWVTRWGLLGFEIMERKHIAFKDQPTSTEFIWIIPHLMVIWAVCVLSAWLLLSKPRKPTPTTEPAM